MRISATNHLLLSFALRYKQSLQSLLSFQQKPLVLTLTAHHIKLTILFTRLYSLFRLARQYVFAIIQGRTVDECFQEEQMKIANETNIKVSGYISATAYQQMKARQAIPSTFTSQIKENTHCIKQEQPKSGSKNILQDKLVNIDSNSNSSSGLSMIDKSSLGLFKSNSMPSFEEAAKMRARRQISFDNVDFPKRWCADEQSVHFSAA